RRAIDGARARGNRSGNRRLVGAGGRMTAYRAGAEPAVKAESGKNAPSGHSRAAEKLRAFHQEDAINKAYDVRLVGPLLPFLRPHARFFAISLGAVALLAAVNLTRPLLMGDVVNQAAAKSTHGLFVDGALLSLFIVLQQLLIFGQTYAMQVGGAKAM